MKLWLLRPIHIENDDPWEPWYNKAFGFVVRAETEDAARQFAHSEAGDENRGEFSMHKTSDTKTPWLDPKYSTCLELFADGDAGIVIRDFAAA
jgi:hypothetical protein